MSDFFWPESLVAEIASRRAVFVLGSGASAGAESPTGLRPPAWEPLLIELADKLDSKQKLFAKRLITEKQFLDAAQVIQDNIDRGDFKRAIESKLKRPTFKASPIQKAIFEMDPKILVTTNYDEIYETYCRSNSPENGHNVCKYYEDHFLNDIRSDTRCILKAHGCVSDPSKIVLSRRSYFDARRKYPSFYKVLDSIFLLNTVIFIGTSLNDPDINLILENVNLSANSDHTHYALVPRGRHPSIAESILKTYNIKLIEYYSSKKIGHKHAESSVMSLRDSVLSERTKLRIP